MINEVGELSLVPLKGKSGKAYIGTDAEGHRVFVKKNTTPLLAALAKEQIAPQLLWAKRQVNGDMVSAQEWLDGRLLTRQDMTSKQIVAILTRLHRSRQLVNQLLQLDYKLETPQDLIRDWEQKAPRSLKENTYLQSIVRDLKQSYPHFDQEIATIVHGDIHHSNWIITTSGMIYLTDWDSVRLTDRMYDVAHMLSHYIPRQSWHDWLVYYGYKDNDKVRQKIAWYGQLSYLSQILKYFEGNNMAGVNREIADLRQFRENSRK